MIDQIDYLQSIRIEFINCAQDRKLPGHGVTIFIKSHFYNLYRELGRVSA